MVCRLNRYGSFRADQRRDDRRRFLGVLVFEREGANRERLRGIGRRIGEGYAGTEDCHKNEYQPFHKSAGRLSSKIMTTCASFTPGTSTIVAVFESYDSNIR